MRVIINENKFDLLISEEYKDISIDNVYKEMQTNQSFRFKILNSLFERGYVFHGTNEQFDYFDSSKIKGGSRGREGYGFYFTKDAYKVEEYGNQFIILSTNGMNIVNTKDSFNRLGISTPDTIQTKIVQLESQLYDVTTNREYDMINNELNNLKTYLNDTIFKDVNYNDYKILKTYNFQPLSENNTLYNALTFAYTKLTGDGMKSMSQIFLNMGIDGYIIDNVYVIINFDKLNKNIVKNKDKLIYDVYKSLT